MFASLTWVASVCGVACLSWVVLYCLKNHSFQCPSAPCCGIDGSDYRNILQEYIGWQALSRFYLSGEKEWTWASLYHFWCSAGNYPDLENRMSIQIRLMGTFGLNGGVL